MIHCGVPYLRVTEVGMQLYNSQPDAFDDRSQAYDYVRQNPTSWTTTGLWKMTGLKTDPIMFVEICIIVGWTEIVRNLSFWNPSGFWKREFRHRREGVRLWVSEENLKFYIKPEFAQTRIFGTERETLCCEQ